MSKEYTTELDLDFNKLAKVANCGHPVIPTVIQDADSKDVLIIGYSNEESFNKTLEIQKAVLWSTSRNVLWIKGETSGDYLNLVEVRVNCEQNSLLFLVKKAQSGACHAKDEDGNTRSSCYYRKVVDGNLEFIH